MTSQAFRNLLLPGGDEQAKSLFTSWLLANTVGSLIVVINNLAVIALARNSLSYLSLVQLVVFMLFPGLLQWLVLRKMLQPLSWGRWLFTTAVGQFVGVLLAALFMPVYFFASTPVHNLFISRLLLAIVLGTGMGLGVGHLQWRVLRLYFVSQPERPWLVGNIVGYVASAILTSALPFAQDKTPIGLTLLVVSTALGGALIGNFTGLALLRLIKSPLLQE